MKLYTDSNFDGKIEAPRVYPKTSRAGSHTRPNGDVPAPLPGVLGTGGASSGAATAGVWIGPKPVTLFQPFQWLSGSKHEQVRQNDMGVTNLSWKWGPKLALTFSNRGLDSRLADHQGGEATGGRGQSSGASQAYCRSSLKEVISFTCWTVSEPNLRSTMLR